MRMLVDMNHITAARTPHRDNDPSCDEKVSSVFQLLSLDSSRGSQHFEGSTSSDDDYNDEDEDLHNGTEGDDVPLTPSTSTSSLPDCQAYTFSSNFPSAASSNFHKSPSTCPSPTLSTPVPASVSTTRHTMTESKTSSLSSGCPSETLILHSPVTLEHNTHELFSGQIIPAMESPARLHSILSALSRNGRPVTTLSNPLPSTLKTCIPRIHSADYLTHLRKIHSQWMEAGLLRSADMTVLPECFPPAARCTGMDGDEPMGPPEDVAARAGYYMFDMSAGVGEKTWEAAVASADLAVRAARALVGKDAINEISSTSPPTTTQLPGENSRVVLALCRPPGHHCASDMSAGYCYLNNTAIGIAELLTHIDPSEQISVLDIDYHHGNGTQKLFYRVPNPAYISIHAGGDYPFYSGTTREQGSGPGKGYTLNLPLKMNVTGGKEYLEALEIAIAKIRDLNTKWLVVSLGFDTFTNDPLGKFKLVTKDYESIGKRIGSIKGVKGVLCILEGGYSVEELGQNLVTFLGGVEEGRKSVKKIGA